MNKNTFECVLLLDQIFLQNGDFDYELVLRRLEAMREQKFVNDEEYLNLLDAANARRLTGHYRDSLIYKRAENDDRSI